MEAYKLVMVQISKSITRYDLSTCNWIDVLKVTKGFSANKNG
jgi:hypothetical protein